LVLVKCPHCNFEADYERELPLLFLTWYGYYTDKTIPEIVIETNKQYNSQVHDFFLDHNTDPKHSKILFTNGKTKRIQYFCAICGFTYSYCSLHAIRLHCFEEHQDGIK
tara:strand:- start:78 stop:404 length:327 start_codon:yes stop_codon:yes gene_type:complete